MEEESTQPSTQLMMDPRRLGEFDSDLSEEDQADVLCILHPASISAIQVASRIAESAPQHTISRAEMPLRIRGADPEKPIVQTDTMTLAEQGLVTRDLALRLSAELKDSLAGFTFGRNEQRCDFVLSYSTTDGAKRISNIHFRIWLSESGVIMLEDQSTNGTWVEGKHLRSKNRENNPPGYYKHTLTHGTLIKLQMVPGQDDDVQFVVRVPRREGPAEELWDNNVAAYFERLGKARGERERARGRQNGAPDIFANQGTAASTAVTASRSHISSRPKEWTGGKKYNKHGVIGKGAFATVYLLTDKFSGDQSAAKEIEKRKFMKNGIVDIKIEQEMGIMKEISHEHIVKFIDTIDYGDHLYIIMEYVPEGSLTSLIEELGPLAESDAKVLSTQMLNALNYLHGKGIAHRDIKPDNVLVQSRPPNLHVKLTDFGLSKRILPEEETFLRTFCGTILYCAPEVYPEFLDYFVDFPDEIRERAKRDKKAKRYDHAIDIWSLGGMVFYSLTALPPYSAYAGMDYQAMLRQIMTGPLDIRPLQKQGVTEWGISFIKSMLCNMPQLRASISSLEEHPWLTGIDPTISGSIETQDTEIGGGQRMPGESFHLDTQMTDVGDLEDQADEADDDVFVDQDGFGESGLEQSASQLSIGVEDNDFDASDGVDLVHDTTLPNPAGRIEVQNSYQSDSFVSFDEQFPQGQTSVAQPALFGEVITANGQAAPLQQLTNTRAPANPRPLIPQLRHDIRTLTMSENSLMDSDSKDLRGGDLDNSLSTSANEPQPSLRFAGDSPTSSLVAEPTATFASSGAMGGRASSLLGAESMVGDMAINSPTPGSADVSSNSLNRNFTASTMGIPPASLRRPRSPDNDDEEETGRPAAKRHQSMVMNKENEKPHDMSDDSIMPASVFFDPNDKSTHHLNYPTFTAKEYQGAVNLARSHGDSFERGGKLFEMVVNTHQRSYSGSRTDDSARAQSEPLGGNPGVVSQAQRAGSESRDKLPFGGQYGGWVNGIPTPEIAEFFPEFADYYDDDGKPRTSSQTAAQDGDFQPPRRILAKLVSTPDSVIPNLTITITEFLTTWGRGFKNTNRYEVNNEDRVPKNALKLILWAPGVKPGDGIPTDKDNDFAFYISTKATHGIKVNNVPVQANEPGEPHKAPPMYWGRLQHGDVVIAWSHMRNKSEIVKFRFDCFWGASSKAREAGDFFDVVEAGVTRNALDRFCQWEESNFTKKKYEADLKEKERKEREGRGRGAGDGGGTASAGTSAASSHTDDGGRGGGPVTMGQSFTA